LKLHARVDCTELINERFRPRPPSTIPHIYAFDRSSVVELWSSLAYRQRALTVVDCIDYGWLLLADGIMGEGVLLVAD